MSAQEATIPGCGPFAPVESAAESLKLAIFERIRAEGSVSRAQISKALSISPATVTTQTASLIEMGLVREKDVETEVARGRPPIALIVEPRAHLVAGLKLSDKEHSAVIYDFAGNQLASAALAVSGDPSLELLLQSTQELVIKVCQTAGISTQDLSAIGVGVPGFVNASTGTAHWSPLIDETEVALADLLAVRLGNTVVIDNDANLIALAELWFGVGRHISDFAVVTIEHGVGMGLVINHKLYSGARGMGMELGHTKVALDGALCRCGQRGCLEAYVADYALIREASIASPRCKPNAPVHEVLETLFDEAKANNRAARSIFERAGKYLAMGIGNVVNLFDPQLIILSGERMQYDFLFSDDTLGEIQRHTLNSGVTIPPVEIHAWGDFVWASGAAAMALAKVTEKTLDTRG
ncbi:ROK family transcriptional regulator [Thalassococcus lentus]|uniref:ROK family transcriptional regulator n=1 Tax=Thalassococcus lentus TaxID=1210524 RepID=A0ABT4XPG1_9RHOB|nr:ROK family transcriptional regulator [Thalassococcus lentus]MDA7423826.1 ROK family transcriptional regulator [Thalassococcus lentus]